MPGRRAILAGMRLRPARPLIVLFVGCLGSLLMGCPTEPPGADPTPPVESVPDERPTPPPVHPDGCLFRLANETGGPIASVSLATSNELPEELVSGTFADGDVLERRIASGDYAVLALDGDDNLYDVGFVVCVLDETLAVVLDESLLRPAGMTIWNDTQSSIVSLKLSDAFTWQFDEILETPLDPIANRHIPIPVGQWYLLAEDSSGTRYLENFALWSDNPFGELVIHPDTAFVGEPCTVTIENGTQSQITWLILRSEGELLWFGDVFQPGMDFGPGGTLDALVTPGLEWTVYAYDADANETASAPFTCAAGAQHTLAVP